MSRKRNHLDIDIYQLLQEASEKRRKKSRIHVLKSVGIKEYFEGSICINKKPAKEWSASYASKLVSPTTSIGHLEKSALLKTCASFACPVS